MFKPVKDDGAKIAKQALGRGASEPARTYDAPPRKVRHNTSYRIPERLDDDLARRDDLNLVYGRKKRSRVSRSDFMCK